MAEKRAGHSRNCTSIVKKMGQTEGQTPDHCFMLYTIDAASSIIHRSYDNLSGNCCNGPSRLTLRRINSASSASSSRVMSRRELSVSEVFPDSSGTPLHVPEVEYRFGCLFTVGSRRISQGEPSSLLSSCVDWLSVEDCSATATRRGSETMGWVDFMSMFELVLSDSAARVMWRCRRWWPLEQGQTPDERILRSWWRSWTTSWHSNSTSKQGLCTVHYKKSDASPTWSGMANVNEGSHTLHTIHSFIHHCHNTILRLYYALNPTEEGHSYQQCWFDPCHEQKNDEFRGYSLLPSVLWRCWLGCRKGIRPVKKWLVGCWRGYLSGARCRLAYSPANATGHSLSLASVKSRLVLPFWYQLTGVVPDKGPLNGCVCVCVSA